MIEHRHINAISRRHDRPYEWPNWTCMGPAMDLIEHVTGEPPQRHPILNLSEREALKVLIRDFGGSWGALGIEYLTVYCYGRKIHRGRDGFAEPLQTGDIVEFKSPFVTPVMSPNGAAIGIVTPGHFYARCDNSVIPVPVANCRVIQAGRIEQCHR